MTSEWKQSIELEQAQKDLKLLQDKVARLTAERDRMENALWEIRAQVCDALHLDLDW
jgi:hypothetical protein